jgi:hypothetical protein
MYTMLLMCVTAVSIVPAIHGFGTAAVVHVLFYTTLPSAI